MCKCNGSNTKTFSYVTETQSFEKLFHHFTAIIMSHEIINLA